MSNLISITTDGHHVPYRIHVNGKTWEVDKELLDVVKDGKYHPWISCISNDELKSVRQYLNTTNY